MKLKMRWAASGLVVGLVATLTTLTSSGATAAAAPGFEPDPNASLGSITFYDASGNVVTGGNNLSHLFDYAVASGASDRVGVPLASTYFAFPDHTKTDSSTWFISQASGATNYPATTAPAPVNGFTTPTSTVGVSEGNLAALLGVVTLDTTPGYANIVQIRLKDSGPGKPARLKPFWATDIQFNSATGTWAQVYPAPVINTATTTALTVSPASPQLTGTSITLSATVAPTTSGDPTPTAGSVQFFDGSTQIGSTQAYAGSAVSVSTSTLAAGAHSLTAKYLPGTGFSGSTSAITSYQINAPQSTTTTLGVSPSSPITVAGTATLTATIVPSSATGTVKFFDGTTQIGADAPVTAGSATTSTSALTVGTHSLKASFVPGSAAFVTSTSAPVSYVVNPLPATTTTTTLTVAPAGPVAYGTSVDLSATVAPSTAVGTVQFKDGTTNLGTPVAVSGGTALKTVSTLTSGSHSLTATFIPTNSSLFGTSASTPAASLTVNAQNTTTALTVTPAGPVDHGSNVTLKATLTPSSATGTVTFKDGGTAIGAPVAVAGGIAQLSNSTLTVATHALTADFTPANATLFAPSASAPVSLVVQNPPPGATHTALTVTPAGPVVAGSTVTLKATVVETGVAGTVQFFDGTTSLGSPVAVAAGIATTADSPALGSHGYTATFTPTDTVAHLPSTSSVVTLLVKAPAAVTNTALTVTPAGPVAFGSSVTLDAAVTPTTAVGSVQFLDGTTVIGTSPLASGTASLTLTNLGGGVHALTARFVPADSTVFAASTSTPAVNLTVNAQPTTTTLVVNPAGPVTEGKPVTLTANLAPASTVGTVKFFDGATLLGTGAVAAGKVKLVTTTLPIGSRSLTATFLPSNAAVFATSTSTPAISLTVVKAPVITVVTVDGHAATPGARLHGGDKVTLTGSGFQPGESVTVVLQSTPVTLATTTASSNGAVTVTVTLPASLAAGAHTLTLRGSVGSAVFSFAAPSAVTPTPTPTMPSSSPAPGGSGRGGSLANTGVRDVAAASAVALVLVLAGGLLLLTQRRRRSH